MPLYVMNPKYRFVYILGGMLGLMALIYQIVDALPEINPGIVLMISIPDMILFFLVYKTYPEEKESNDGMRSM